MPRSYDVITFDCYGTLIDWESGIREAFVSAARAAGVALEGDAVMTAYHDVEVAVETNYAPYRDVLAESAIRVGRQLGWTIDDPSFLPRSLPSWRPFADTNRALESLRDAGFSLGILSNVDRDLLDATRKHFTVDFDIVITAEDVKSYKPALAHFVTAREKIGGHRWLHAAQSNFHDIVPANALGIPSAWVNRKHAIALPGGVPLIEVAALDELASRLA